MKIVITGGHHSSALPVIEELKNTHPDAVIVWIGHKYSLLGDKNTTLEYREITSLGFPFYDLKAGKVYKTFNIGRLLKVPLGFFQAFGILHKVKPDVILSFGGYLAVPVVLAGWLLRISSVTHEQTVVVGYANKVISKFADKILISWPDSLKYFPKSKTVLTGIPLRDEIFHSSSNSFHINPNLPTIYITAGKTGSLKINKAVLESLSELLGVANVIHQCGDHSEYNDYDLLVKEYKKIEGNVEGKFFPRKFVLAGEIGEAFDKASLVISRAGAHTCMELLALEKPSILIPIPWVSHNEQYRNALVLKEAGLGVILEEKDLTSATLFNVVQDTIKNLNTYKLGDNPYRGVVKRDAAKRIVEELLSVKK